MRDQEARVRAAAAPRPRAPLVVEGAAGRLVLRHVADDGCALFVLEERPRRPRGSAAHGLTPREAEVLGWVAEGKRNPEIAAIPGLSPRTVGHHLARTYARLGVENRTAAARIALTAGETPW